MRLRDESLRTGRLLAHLEGEGRRSSRSLFFLVRGAEDVAPLTAVERICRAWIQQTHHRGFEWHSVVDQNALLSVDPALDSAALTRIEVCELAGRSDEVLRTVLEPALERLAVGEPELFPSASGAVGGVARGVQFLGRGKDIAALERGVKAGRSFLLLAPRRSGKTSLLRRLEERLAADCAVLFLDLQRDPTPEDLAARAWSLVVGDLARSARERVREKGWGPVLWQAVQRLQPKGRPRVLLLDELTYLLHHLPSRQQESEYRQEVEWVLAELSTLRAKGGASMIIAGSLDLADFLRDEVGLDTDRVEILSCLYPHRLSHLAIGDEDTVIFSVLLGSGLVLEKGDLNWLREHFDLALPWVGLRFLDRVSAHLRSGRKLRGTDLTDELDKFLSETEVFREVDSKLSRLGLERPGVRPFVDAALDQLCQQGVIEGSAEDDLRALLPPDELSRGKDLLTWLVDNLPLCREDGRVSIASRLFLRWWEKQ